MRLSYGCERVDSNHRSSPYEGDEIGHFSTPQWVRELDLNQRPPAYEADELPTALSRNINGAVFGRTIYPRSLKVKGNVKMGEQALGTKGGT